MKCAMVDACLTHTSRVVSSSVAVTPSAEAARLLASSSIMALQRCHRRRAESVMCHCAQLQVSNHMSTCHSIVSFTGYSQHWIFPGGSVKALYYQRLTCAAASVEAAAGRPCSRAHSLAPSPARNLLPRHKCSPKRLDALICTPPRHHSKSRNGWDCPNALILFPRQFRTQSS